MTLDRDFLTFLVFGLILVGALGVAGYFILRAIFIRAAEAVSRRMASAIDDLARVAGATRAGQTAATIARRFAAGSATHLDAYAAVADISEDAARREFERSIDRVARVMDAAVKIPILGPIGLDAVLGLVPFVGDATSAAVSVSLIAKSLRYGVPREIVAKMLANVLLDLVVGAIPVVGDIADMWFRANTRNVDLLRQYLASRVTNRTNL